MFEIKHYCHESDREPTNYAIAHRETPPPALTIMICQKCHERIVLVDEGILFSGSHAPSLHRTPGTLIVPGRKD